MAEKIVCDYFIVSQSETIKSAVIGGCRVSGEPMGFRLGKWMPSYYLTGGEPCCLKLEII